ncbi:MAG: hypothetical protein WCX95_03330 [Candidatus Gracilibacteria bacterium]
MANREDLSIQTGPWTDRASPILDSFREQRPPSWPRRHLPQLGVGALVVSLCVGFGKDAYDTVYGNGLKATQALEEVLNDPEQLDQVKESEIIPEDERSGQNLLISAHPMRRILKERGYETFFETTFKTMFDLLPDDTNIHLIVPEDSSELALEVARKMFPRLNFATYDMPPAYPGIEYAQDTFFATGGFDEQGRSILATSSCDKELIAQTSLKEDKAPLKMADLLPFSQRNRRAISGVILLGDELLAKRYPHKFTKRDVPVRLEGGDMHISRMPDGKIALIVGLKNLAETVATGVNTTKGTAIGRGNTIDITTVLSFKEEVRDLYKKSFSGVDEVIFLGEDFLPLMEDEQLRLREITQSKYPEMRDNLLYRDLIDRKSLISPHNSLFFHLDMMLKTVTTPSGEHVAICTEFNEEQALTYFKRTTAQLEDDQYDIEHTDKIKASIFRELRFLEVVQRQFAELGYKIVKIPCGPVPTMNYTNSVVFKGKGDEKIAIVPQYGIPEDAQALEVYRDLGFTVLAPSYKDFIDETIDDTTSAVSQVLRDAGARENSHGLEGIGSYHCKTVILGEMGRKESEKAAQVEPVKSTNSVKTHNSKRGSQKDFQRRKH